MATSVDLAKKIPVPAWIAIGLIVFAVIFVFKLSSQENGQSPTSKVPSTSCDLRCLRERYGDNNIWTINENGNLGQGKEAYDHIAQLSVSAR